MTSPYADLSRPPLSAAALGRALSRDTGGFWSDVRVVAVTGSTNVDVAAAARAGAAEGLVIVAEVQRAARGRLDRSWSSPSRAGLTFSMLFRPPADPARWPLLSLLVATAAAYATIDRTEVAVRLKWPNDLVVSDRKLAGVLAEVAGGGVVVGVGLNVSTRRDELPREDATSLQLERDATAEPVDRAPLLLAVLRAVGTAYQGWVEAGCPPELVLTPYRALSATLGRTVRVELPAGGVLEGIAADVAESGELVVDAADGRHVLAAGDVIHLRPA
ncbi:biotin--[acetyl-CoA-carboxylase] ligase [Acidothermaceae bacterium B102]|nr:biotin--[acetyl-CoA-carboxylase] ligase [Acidothermaceae bacterium B102]